MVGYKDIWGKSLHRGYDGIRAKGCMIICAYKGKVLREIKVWVHYIGADIRQKPQGGGHRVTLGN